MEDNNLIEIPNFNNYKFDKVKNQVLNTTTNKYIKNCLHKTHNFNTVQLYKNKKNHSIRLDKIIYLAHNPSIDIDIEDLEIYHIDEDTLNNNIENLQHIIENESIVDIKGYPKYKFNLNTNKVLSMKTNKYIKQSICTKGYCQVGVYQNRQRIAFQLHRLVYQCNNPNEDISLFQIDHIDNNKLNNNIENLRVATQSENMCNTQTQQNNTSGYKNIRQRGNLFQVQIAKDKKKYIKSFNSLEEAIIYRDMKLIELHGNFASRG